MVVEIDILVIYFCYRFLVIYNLFSPIFKNRSCLYIHRKNDFAEGSKILLDTDLKIILLDHQNNFVETLKIMSNAPKNFDILAF